ncbi:hypothetical protein CALCODRAFT_484410 [Calocera cornea HHB12733]|uniref:Uncharacterized protein n=1 Tax=Calocera cornea HHB12733 TaxID=1353952 RepID=A0A165EZK2_9BASI|nr:hypothetical protein CALCODRAFT_484410 [Calocera cornea HHB12733]
MVAHDGLPTDAEIAALGPPLFTWEELMDIVDGGDLGLLKRQPALQRRYDEWTKGTKARYGTIETFLLERRLHWSPPPMLSSADSFSPSTPSTHYRAVRNDWPYSVPADVVHFVVWSAVPLIGPGDLGEAVERKGMWGFTGGAEHRPPAGEDEGKGEDRRGFGGESGEGITAFVKREWPEEEWETAWFMNPPKLQSVRGLVHFHVFALPKAKKARTHGTHS